MKYKLNDNLQYLHTVNEYPKCVNDGLYIKIKKSRE
jgi:hypothetical protein